MNVRNCTRCGKIYNYTGLRICPSCRKDDEEDFQKAREYLYDNPGANMQEVHEATDVEINKIIEFLREGRLAVGESSNLILECENCGTSIKTGRFCDKCASGLQRELRQVVKGSSSSSSSKSNGREKFRVAERYKNK